MDDEELLEIEKFNLKIDNKFAISQPREISGSLTLDGEAGKEFIDNLETPIELPIQAERIEISHTTINEYQTLAKVVGIANIGSWLIFLSYIIYMM